MDRFVNRQNIDRYRRLAREATNANDRLQIMKLLAEEEAKFKLELRVPTSHDAPRPSELPVGGELLAENEGKQEEHAPARNTK